jgi:hypothetical protein
MRTLDIFAEWGEAIFPNKPKRNLDYMADLGEILFERIPEYLTSYFREKST